MWMFKGWLGELKTGFNLWAGLDSSLYHSFHDVIIPSNHGTTQVDHIVVSPFGLFVVETKNYKGWIYGSADRSTWTQVIYKSKYKFQNPLRQTHRHKKILSKHLDVKESNIQPLISFAGDAEFKTELPSNVLRSGASSYIKQFKEVVFSDDEVSRISDALSKMKTESKISKSAHIQSLHNRYASDTVCPKCGSGLVMREVKQGPKKGTQFLGCSSYPKCRFTKDIKRETEGNWTFAIIVIFVVIGIIWWGLD